MYQFLDPIFGLLILVSLIMLTLLLTVLAQSLPDKPTNFTKWIFKTFNPIPGSVIFWNGLFWALFVSTGLVWPVLALGISTLLSLFLFAATVDGMEMRYHTWAWCTLYIYFGIALVGVGITLHYIWKNTIVRFNNYLDKKKHANNN